MTARTVAPLLLAALAAGGAVAWATHPRLARVAVAVTPSPSGAAVRVEVGP